MRPFAASLAAAVLLIGFPALGHAEDLSSDEIVDRLKPAKKLTRSLQQEGLSDQQKARLDGLTRAIAVVPREKKTETLAEIAAVVEEAKLPKLDFEIYFAYDSADILPESQATLDALGKALATPDLASTSYLVNGHTDAKGSDAYNQSLSERRAEAVVTYLVTRHPIDPAKLKPLGYGESRLKAPASPEAAVNRRVEIVNLTY